MLFHLRALLDDHMNSMPFNSLEWIELDEMLSLSVCIKVIPLRLFEVTRFSERELPEESTRRMPSLPLEATVLLTMAVPSE